VYVHQEETSLVGKDENVFVQNLFDVRRRVL
jgi:hypothetical protein